MKKLISIIVFLLFFLISFNSYSFTPNPTPPSCQNLAYSLSMFENEQIYNYIYLKDSELYELDGKDIELNKKNNSLFVNWPKFNLNPIVLESIEIEFQENLKKYTFCKNNKKNSFYYKVNETCRENDEKLPLEEYILQKPKALKIFKSGVINKHRGVYDDYHSSIPKMEELQLEIQSYPIIYNFAYDCEPTKEEKEIIAEDIEKKHQKLKTLFDKGLITENEYISQTKEIFEEKYSKGFDNICSKQKTLPKCDYNPMGYLSLILDTLKIN